MSRLPENLQSKLKSHFSGSIQRVSSIGGGCIANASRVETSEATYFLKWGRGDVARTFTPEADGLRALRAANSPLTIPEPVAASPEEDGVPGFLLLSWIEQGAKVPDYDEQLGRGLAELHRHTAESYGFDSDNFIGRLPQENPKMPLWPDFFRQARLEPQVARARASGRWQSAWDAPLKALYRRLDSILPSEPPASIVHGDLWSGNVMPDGEGRPCIFDPAAYYGHREVDLAMSELFGGFGRPFYDAYDSAWPMESGYPERREVYNLYHLINHLNHFGSSYAGRVKRTLDRFA